MELLARTAAAVAGVYMRTGAQLAARLWATAAAATAAAASVDVAAAAGGVLEGAQHSALLANTTGDAFVGLVKACPAHVAGNVQRHLNAVMSLDAASAVLWIQTSIVRSSSAGLREDMQGDLAAAAHRVVTEEYLPALICVLFIVLLGYFWAYKRPGHALIDDDFLGFFSFASSVRASLKSAAGPPTVEVDLLNSSEPLSPTMEDFMQEKDQIKKRALAKAAIIKANSTTEAVSVAIRGPKRGANPFDPHRKAVSGYKSSKVSEAEFSTGYSVISASSIGGESMISDLSSVQVYGDMTHEQVMAASLMNARVLENWEVEIEGHGKGVILQARKIKFMSTKFVVRFPDNSRKTLALKRSDTKGKIPFALVRKVA